MVIGSGGREHAIVHKLSQSSYVSEIIVVSGNGGTNNVPANPFVTIINVSLDLGNVAGIVTYAKQMEINLVVVGPEQPLVDGIVDAMTTQNIPCFGPTSKAARIEASKAWSKDFMKRHSIPTAKYSNFTDPVAASAYLKEHKDTKFVIKASGLAAGKGVIIPADLNESLQAVQQILVEKVFGVEAGEEIVIEEFLEGEEVSLLAFCDGITAVPMPPAQDHKRIYDKDEGPNTGGMGAYAPAPVLTPSLHTECVDIIKKSVSAMGSEGFSYKGVLYAGFMLTKKGPYLLEYNCRFGDPETQVLLPLLKSDLYEVMMACCSGALDSQSVIWEDGFACTVVCAAPGYPGAYPKDLEIHGTGQADLLDGVTVYHAGTTVKNGTLVTNGGRVLAVTGVGSTLRNAVATAYQGVSKVCYQGIHFRKDIAHRGLSAPILIGVLASTRGTALQPVIDAINSGKLNAKIVLIISNKIDSGVLERAKNHNIPCEFLSATGKSREEYDKVVTQSLQAAGVQLVLMVGYMRIVSSYFTSFWDNRCLNVHPSLLPDFAGGMDLQVHRDVLQARKTKSGCTIHFVTDQVDGGPILLQEECSVNPDVDTPEILKDRVQALEGISFIKAIEMYRYDMMKPYKFAAAATASKAITYKSAGVDIDAGEALVEAIKPYCKATRRPGCDADLGGFGGLFDLSQAGYNASETVLVSGTDGVGTKLKIAQAIGKHDTIGIDLVAMCVNDILVCGAEPLFFLDYYATGALNVKEAAEVVKGIAEGCLQSQSSLIGGETAEMAGMYKVGEYDLAGFSVGAVKRSEILPRNITYGDIVLGLRSSGVHSNGYSLVRKCVEKSGLNWDDQCPFEYPGQVTLGEALLTPTRIYVKSLMPLIKQGLIKGMAHITGGGLLDNIPRVLEKDHSVLLDINTSGWKLPPVFKWLQSIACLPQPELHRTFNCGIGMVVIIAPENLDSVLTKLAVTEGEANPVYILGRIEKRTDFNSPQVNVIGELN